jgi:hypothetical protein
MDQAPVVLPKDLLPAKGEHLLQGLVYPEHAKVGVKDDDAYSTAIEQIADKGPELSLNRRGGHRW